MLHVKYWVSGVCFCHQGFQELALRFKVSRWLRSKASPRLSPKCRCVSALTRQTLPSFHRLFHFDVAHLLTPASPQELTGQQQTSPEESEFDFPPDDGAAFSSSEFGEEAADFPADPAGSSQDATGAYRSAAAGKQALFEGYNDPGKQFGGHTRSYHQDARYSCTTSAFDYSIFDWGKKSILGLIAIMTNHKLQKSFLFFFTYHIFWTISHNFFPTL